MNNNVVLNQDVQITQHESSVFKLSKTGVCEKV